MQSFCQLNHVLATYLSLNSIKKQNLLHSHRSSDVLASTSSLASFPYILSSIQLYFMIRLQGSMAHLMLRHCPVSVHCQLHPLPWPPISTQWDPEVYFLSLPQPRNLLLLHQHRIHQTHTVWTSAVFHNLSNSVRLPKHGSIRIPTVCTSPLWNSILLFQVQNHKC